MKFCYCVLGYLTGLRDGSTTLYSRFLNGIDGLCIDANTSENRFADRLFTKATSYHYPCAKFEWTADSPPTEDYIASFSPKNSSIIWSTDQYFYGESMSADIRSVALYTKSSAYNNSIAMKGGVAVNSSFAMGYADNGNNYNVLEASAIDNSVAIYASYAKNNSMSMTTEISNNDFNTVSAVNNSMLLMHAISKNENAVFTNSSFAWRCDANDGCTLSVDNSYLVPTDTIDLLHIKDRTFLMSIANKSEKSVTRTHTVASNSYLLQYAASQLYNYVDSLCISMNDCGKNTASQFNVVDSVVLGANKLESSSIVNSLLLATHNTVKPIDDIYTVNSINIASPLSTTAEARCRMLLPAFAITEKDTVSIANPLKVDNLTDTIESLLIADEPLQLTGSCKNNVILASKNNIVYNANCSIGLLDTGLSASSAYGCLNCGISQQSATVLMNSTAISEDQIVSQSLAVENATTSADKSIAMFSSKVTRLFSDYADKVPYAFAMFAGEPTYSASRTSIADNRLSFWADALRKRDLPITQFKKISTISSLQELENDVVYIITG